ncbi:DUF559 domain-containing protein [Kribbella sp. NPDC056345]|uniref:DUF559 domain-containing protein n=1 Tax=Kribbella sp. NPDC056345 TaxID=3345789 RepID=UPI0035D72B39
MDSLADIVARLGGSAHAAQLLQLTTERKLRAAVQGGELERVARGHYALPSLGPHRLAALAYDGVASHVSAAHLWGLPLLTHPELPHVTVPVDRRARRGRPAVLHWGPVTGDERLARTTTLLRTVIDCARILPLGEALAVADAALRTRRLSPAELETAATGMRGFGRPLALQVAAAATPLAESFLESVFRGLLISAGFTEFEPQVVVHNAMGFIGRVDLGSRQLRLALEVEGYEFHGRPDAFAADCRRYDDLVAAGWLVLRFTYQQILWDPTWVVDTVRAAVSLRTRSGAPDQPGSRLGVAAHRAA